MLRSPKSPTDLIYVLSQTPHVRDTQGRGPWGILQPQQHTATWVLSIQPLSHSAWPVKSQRCVAFWEMQLSQFCAIFSVQGMGAGVRPLKLSRRSRDWGRILLAFLKKRVSPFWLMQTGSPMTTEGIQSIFLLFLCSLCFQDKRLNKNFFSLSPVPFGLDLVNFFPAYYNHF